MCSAPTLKTKGPYSTDKTFYFHKETINIKCDKGFKLLYEYFDSSNSYNYYNESANDIQINTTCSHGKIYLNDSMQLTGIACRPSNYLYFCIQVLTTSANNWYYTNPSLNIYLKLTKTIKIVKSIV